MFVYQILLINEYNVPAFIFVISTYYKEDFYYSMYLNEENWLTMYIKSLYCFNQHKTLNTFEYKNNIKEDYSDAEKFKFLLIPIMDLRYKELSLKRTLFLSPGIPNLTNEEAKKMINIQLNYAIEWFDDETYKKIGGYLNTGLDPRAYELLKEVVIEVSREEGNEEGIEIGKVEGIKSNNNQGAVKMISEDLPISTISRVTDLSVDEINSLNSK